jgi:hypothetical protein
MEPNQQTTLGDQKQYALGLVTGSSTEVLSGFWVGDSLLVYVR